MSVPFKLRACTGEWLVATLHVVERWQERCCPALDFEAAEWRLRMVWPSHAFAERPEWVAADDVRPGDRWIVLGDDIAFLVRARTLVTVMVAGTPSDRVLEARSERRAARASARARVRRERGSARARAARMG